MAQITKPLAVLLSTGVGILFLVFLFDNSKKEVQEELVISKTGAWQNTKFTHLVDYNFGASLVYILMKNNIASITDLGCGTGHYVKMIESFNIKTQGFDGNPDTKKWDASGGLCVGPVDLVEEKFWDVTDAAMSIEVAEHIPAEYEQAFLNNLVNSARNLIFLSWGVPGQGGEGHVNGQWGADVVQKMKERGWERNDNYTNMLTNDATFDWLKKNVQVFNRMKDNQI